MAETDYVCDVADDATVRGAVRSVFGASGDAVGTAICALRDDQVPSQRLPFPPGLRGGGGGGGGPVRWQ